MEFILGALVLLVGIIIGAGLSISLIDRKVPPSSGN